MRASLVQRGKTWNVLLSTESDNGERKQKLISTGIKSKKFAETILSEIMCKVNKNEYVVPSE